MGKVEWIGLAGANVKRERDAQKMREYKIYQ